MVNSFVGIVAAVVAGTVAASVGAGTILHMSYQRHDESLGKLKNLYVQLSVYLDGHKGENGNGHTGGSPANRFPDKEAAEIEASLSLSEVSNVLELFRKYRAEPSDELADHIIAEFHAEIKKLKADAIQKVIKRMLSVLAAIVVAVSVLAFFVYGIAFAVDKLYHAISSPPILAKVRVVNHPRKITNRNMIIADTSPSPSGGHRGKDSRLHGVKIITTPDSESTESATSDKVKASERVHDGESADKCRNSVCVGIGKASVDLNLPAAVDPALRKVIAPALTKGINPIPQISIDLNPQNLANLPTVTVSSSPLESPVGYASPTVEPAP